MSVFRHPHLVRGIVHTSEGKFAVNRGLVDVPDEVGDSNGWLRLEPEDQGGGPILTERPARHRLDRPGRTPAAATERHNVEAG